MFRTVILREPAPEMVDGISNARMGLPDYAKAVKQHRAYVEALKACDVETVMLEALPQFPDSVFVEDVAICTPNCAIVTRPGAASRRDEIYEIREVLPIFFQNVISINSPGTLDGGDVMKVGDHYYIGLSNRTNKSGAKQLIKALNKHELSGSIISINDLLHLKTGVSYLENNLLLTSDVLAEHPEFQSFKKIIVPPEEAYAANAIWVNDKIILPAGSPKTSAKLKAEGLKLIKVPMSEFQKLDGGVSCLSLRF